jgi:hypothetical protein
MRIQSLPAISADNCAAFIRITPSTTDGHLKPPPSSRFPIQHKATAIPDDNLHPIGALRTEDDCCSSSDLGPAPPSQSVRPSAPFLKSTGRVAT